MAKRTVPSLPEVPAALDGTEAQSNGVPSSNGRELVQPRIALFVLNGPPLGYVSNHVDAKLDARQALVLRQIRDGLDSQGARLRSGARVNSTADAVRWLLEQVPIEV